MHQTIDVNEYPIITTDEYPTRYKAGRCPAVWVKNAKVNPDSPRAGAGEEWAVLCLEMPNRVYPGINDGITITVTNHNNRRLVLECLAMAPTAGRPYRTLHQRYPFEDFEKALADGWKWFLAARQWVESVGL